MPVPCPPQIICKNIFESVENPPGGINESCTPLTAPHIVVVVIIAQSAVCTQPNLTSFPSKLGYCDPNRELTRGFPWYSPITLITTKKTKMINTIQKTNQACLTLLASTPYV